MTETSSCMHLASVKIDNLHTSNIPVRTMPGYNFSSASIEVEKRSRLHLLARWRRAAVRCDDEFSMLVADFIDSIPNFHQCRPASGNDQEPRKWK